MTNKVGNVMVTTNYEKFKRLDGNRDVKEFRIRKIVESIKEKGQIASPIIVNERMEVVDGQARLEAFRRLNLPVFYVVCEGAGIKDCTTMNATQTSWGLMDFIKSEAERGNVSYRYLQALVDRYHGEFGISTICAAATMGNVNGTPLPTIKDGKLNINAEEYQKAINLLEYCKGLNAIKLEGRKDYFYIVVIWLIKSGIIDKERLKNKLIKYRAMIKPVVNNELCAENLEEIINYRERGERVYVKQMFKEAVKKQRVRALEVAHTKARASK